MRACNLPNCPLRRARSPPSLQPKVTRYSLPAARFARPRLHRQKIGIVHRPAPAYAAMEENSYWPGAWSARFRVTFTSTSTSPTSFSMAWPVVFATLATPAATIFAVRPASAVVFLIRSRSYVTVTCSFAGSLWTSHADTRRTATTRMARTIVPGRSLGGGERDLSVLNRSAELWFRPSAISKPEREQAGRSCRRGGPSPSDFQPCPGVRPSLAAQLTSPSL